MAEETTLKIYRGDNQQGEMVEYKVPVAPGMVVLDAVHAVQAMHAPDLAVRWNCKEGKCGSCSGEVNGKPMSGLEPTLNGRHELSKATMFTGWSG